MVESPAVGVGLALHPSCHEEGVAEAGLGVVGYRDRKATAWNMVISKVISNGVMVWAFDLL